MPTSKLPVDWVSVPEMLYSLAERDPRVVCNSRTFQRPIPRHETDADRFIRTCYVDDSFALDRPALDFLRTVEKGTHLLIHFQGYGHSRVGTAVVQIEGISFFDLPRLDFKHPGSMEQIHGCPNFWASFILAMAKVPSDTEIFCVSDPDCRKFFEVIDSLSSQ